jgi:hypothetical protein
MLCPVKKKSKIKNRTLVLVDAALQTSLREWPSLDVCRTFNRTICSNQATLEYPDSRKANSLIEPLISAGALLKVSKALLVEKIS